MPGTDKNDPAKTMDKNQQQSNGSAPKTSATSTTTTTPTTTTATASQQSQPTPVPGRSSNSGMVIQSTGILGPSALPSTASTSNMANIPGLMSNPIATKQLVMSKFLALKNALQVHQVASGVGTTTTIPTTAPTIATRSTTRPAMPTPSCNAVSAPQGSTLIKPEATCPSPPDWEKYLAKALQAGTPFTRTPIDSTSTEYVVISDLVSSLNFTKIERVVNPGLWNKFVCGRRDCLIDKSNDLNLLKGLKLHPTMVDIQRQSIKKFKVDPSMAAAQYSDNMALLFHGTKGNLEDILSQGLDERFGKSEGLLGRGLYFADNPIKSIAYDTHGVLIIFAVYLGDCMAVDHLTSNKSTFVREPKKLDKQMRTPTDLFFDSIVGRPNPLTPTNEFVIYNRNKCCPMYIVSYDRKHPRREKPLGTVDRYAEVRKQIPPFAWTPKPAVVPAVNGGGEVGSEWPFFAKVIFDLMNKKKDETEKELKELEQEATDTSIKLSLILELGLPGFTDDSVNLTLLRQFNFDLEKTIDYILNHQPTPMEIDDGIEVVYSSIKTNVPTNSNASDIPAKLLLKFQKVSGEWKSVPLNGLPPQSPIRTPLKEDCLICCNEFPPTPNHWVILKCTHKLCTDCHRNIVTEGETMGGVKHKSVKCPFCQSIDGIQIGTCPTGTMKVTMNSPGHMHCEGYEDFGVIIIAYEVNQGKYKVKRPGFLPNSPEGLKVLNLLKIAWDRRLCFSIGRSVTTGVSDVLVWNVHHKTSLKGGSANYGYPDPTYLTRVTQELKQLGVQ